MGPRCPRNQRGLVWYRSQCLPLDTKMGIEKVIELPQFGNEAIEFQCGGGEFTALLGVETCQYSNNYYEFNSRRGCGQCIAQSLPWETVRNGVSQQLANELKQDGYVFF